jgi:hypothetical protein
MAWAAVQVVVDGRATAVVVTADDASPVARYAAAELIEHVRMATGVELPRAVESDVPEGYASRLFLGATRAAREQGIVADQLPPEAFVMRSVGGDLIIVGAEDDRDPLSPSNSQCGTLFGVYELLERCLGVRWLWPGPLGTYVPPTDTVTIEAVDQTVTPRLAFREIAWGRIRDAAIRQNVTLSQTEQRLGFSPAGLVRYGHDLQDLLRRHRMGGMDRKPSTGHHFTGWWERHGDTHPEWFMMHEDGSRGPSKASGVQNVPMCVSNPDLHQFIVQRWDGQSVIRLGEVDWPDACRCPECRDWDGPQPDPVPDFLVSQTDSGAADSSLLQRHRGHVLSGFYHPMCTSDRYARFWATVQRLAAQRNPQALVTTYIYYSYFPAPAKRIELGEHVFGEFVPWGNPQHTDFFPVSDQALKWLKQQWAGWQRTGMRMAYRPNYLHDGWVMPWVEVRQAAEFFQFAVEHGMEGSRFDSLTGQWAAQGPKLYVHLRLHAKPDLAVEQILDEYYGAFGPAADQVRAYFEYWEQYCRDHRQRINDLYIDVGHRWSRFQLQAHRAFPPSSFEPAAEHLQRARQAAQDHPRPEYAQRVEFLAAGLRHAQLAGRLAEQFDGHRDIPEDSPRFEPAVQALRELIEFRRAHETPYIADFYYGAAWREGRFWNLRPLLAKLDPENETHPSDAATTPDPSGTP